MALPLLMVLVLVVVQVGLVARDRLLLAHVAREAARAAAVAPDGETATEAADRASGLNSGRLHVVLSGGRQPGDRLTVTVGYRSTTDVPVVGPMLPDLDLESTVTIRVE